MLIIKLFFGYLFIVLPYFPSRRKCLRISWTTKQNNNKTRLTNKKQTHRQTRLRISGKKLSFKRFLLAIGGQNRYVDVRPTGHQIMKFFRQIGSVIFNRKSWLPGPLNWGYVFLTNCDVISIWNAEKYWLRRHGLQFHSRYTRQLANRLDSLLMHPSVNFWVNPHNWMLRQVLIHVPQLLPN